MCRRADLAAPRPGPELYKRGDVYWCRYVIGGVEKRVSLRTADVKKARPERDSLLRGADDARAGRAPEVVHRWEDAVEVFLAEVLTHSDRYPQTTADRYKTSIRKLSPILEGVPLAEITTGTVSDFVAARRDDDVSVSTIKNDLTAWSMVLSYAVSKRMADSNAARTYDRRWLGHDADQINPPTDFEIDEILADLGTWHPAMVRLFRWLRETGMRLKEALMIEFSDVHPSGTHATLRRGVKGNKKSGLKTRTINLGRASNLIKADRKAGRVFAELATDSAVVSTRYGQWRRQRQAREKLNALAEGREAVEMRSFRIHDLRHAFAITSLIDDPKRIYELQKHMGHSSIKTTEIYVRFVDREGLSRSQQRNREMFGSLPVESEIRDAAE